MSTYNDGEVVLSRITITRVMAGGDDEIRFVIDGEPLLIDTVGMLQIALYMILKDEMQ